MARLRRVAMTWGPLPVRIWEESSPKVTSRTWWRASMPQWPRTQAASCAGVAWWAARLVTAQLVSVDHFVVPVTLPFSGQLVMRVRFPPRPPGAAARRPLHRRPLHC
jgi:hypothetical protein